MIAKKLSAYVLVLLMTATAFAFVSWPASASYGGADAYGYTWTDSNSPDPAVSFNWVDISSTGTSIGFSYADDDVSSEITIGFSFPFYDDAYTDAYVSTNGFLSFTSASYDYWNYPIPDDYDPNALVAPYWDDLVVYYPSYNYGAVYYETLGAAPDRQFVVQWDEITRGYNYDLMTFEIILNETGEIWFQYLTMSGLDGSAATVGIENSDGAYGCEYGYNEAVITDGLAIMFEQGPIGFGPDQRSYGFPGDSMFYDLSIRNNGLTTESYDIEFYWSDLGWTVEMYDAGLSGLVDNNGNTIPDTGDLLPGEEYWMIVEVIIPDMPTSLFETTVLMVSAYSDPTVNDTATLVTQSTSIDYVTPHSDSVYDSDSDGDYDYLVVNVSLWSFLDQSAYMYVTLYSPSLYYLYGSTEYVYVTEGFSNITVYLPGEEIYNYHENGSFYVSIFIYDADWNSIDYSNFYTSSYNYDDFDPPGVLFSTPYSDFGLDTDGDSYYDALVVNITLEVLKDGYYTIQMYVYDYFYDDYITDVMAGWNLSAGEVMVQISIPGLDIYESGLDGPYVLYMDLYDDFNSTDDDTYETGTYGYTDFDGPDIMFSPPHEDYAVDTDSDYYDNEVVIEVYIDCLSAGYYDLVIYIEDYWGYEFDYIDETVYFDMGATTYYVVLDSYSIITNGISGQFYLYMYLVDSSTFEELDYDDYSTGYYYVSDFDPIGAFFYPPYDDYGRDDDSDGLYDVLVFSVNVESSYAGWYDIDAYIYDPYWNDYYEEVTVYLEQDVLTVVEIELDSYSVWASGYDGEWYIEMYLYDHYSYTYYDWDYFYTDYYYVDDFDPLPAIFGSPHDDYALDVDGDSLYDYLYVDVIVDCYEAGEYTLWADLYNPWGAYITAVSVTESMTFGLHSVELVFDGWMIELSGGTGSYYLEMWLEDEHGYELDYDEYYTDYYYYYEFASVPAEFTSPYSDYAVDSDDDTLYEYLVVVVSVDVYVPGEYIVYGVLNDDYDDPVDVALNRVVLDEGVSEVELWFDAWTIASADGDPDYVELTLTDVEDNTMDEDSYDLGTYYNYEFDPTVPSIDSGWAYDPPAIDGAVSEDEWFGAAVIDLVVADPMNAIDATMYILNDGEFLYILIDATGDMTETDGDGASVAFDTGDDEVTTDGHEDQFVLEASEMGPDSYHLVFDSYYWEWEVDCSPFDELLADHDGLAGAIGFDSSPDSATAHRIYELSIPLSLLMMSPGDSIGFAGLSDMSPCVVDEVEYDYSTWPAFFWDAPELDMYGTLTLSEEPPLTVVELDGTLGDGGWYVSAVEVTLTATGGMGGVNATYYSLDGGAWNEYTDAFTVSTQRSHTLRYYSDDTAGNEEPVRTVTIGLDWTEPTALASASGTEGDNDWFLSEVTVSLSGSDGSTGSGISTLMYRLDGGSWTEYTSSISVDGDGEHTIECYAIDVAGNEGDEYELTFSIDTTAPETTASVSDGTVTLAASDATSGVNYTMYRVDDGEWTLYTGAFEVTGSGNHTVEFYSVDNAGNEGAMGTEDFEVSSGLLDMDATVFFVLAALLAIIVAIIVIVLIVMRNKRKGAGPTQFHDSSIPQSQVEGSYPPMGPNQDLPPPPEQ